MVTVDNRVKQLGTINEKGARLVFMENNYYVRTLSFADFYQRLLDYFKYDVISKTQFNNYFGNIIDLAYRLDNNNKILIDYKEELLNDERNYYNILNNKLIHMNNIYSVVVLDFKTETFLSLNYGASNLADLYLENLKHKHELNLELVKTQLDANFNTENLLRVHHAYVLHKYNGTITLDDLLESQYMNQINKIMDNKFYVRSIVAERHNIDNTFMYWENFKFYTFKFVGYDDSVSYEIIPVDTFVKLACYVQYSWVRELEKNELFFNLGKNKMHLMIRALKLDTHGIDGTDLSSRFSSDSESSVELNRQARQNSSNNIQLFQSERAVADKLIGYVSNIFNKRG
uniref:hypothetical protein n=1 Tax=Porodaedalea mongolica TaxID=2651638 RepID=UPI0021ACF654|nr:hypothetical protein NYK79_mgp52 [Porodaedalea mongolica]UUA03938.1 hypothetical protein [Porodaedalea mongolica]WCF76698.1 hypothetical protein [Porodaedalea mongolica]